MKNVKKIFSKFLKWNKLLTDYPIFEQITSNIATLKYWGKRDEELIIPLHDNISVTLSSPSTITTVSFSEEYPKDFFFIDGVEQEISERFLRSVELARSFSTRDFPEHLAVISNNSFPTASGLASSASGFANLAFSLSTMMGIDDKELQSVIARVGSGSACRGVYGGWVKWLADSELGSHAVQIHDSDHWDLEIFICQVTSKRKEVSSTLGQRLSVERNALSERVEKFVPEILPKMEESIQKRDSEEFFQLLIEDCENFHSVCRATDKRMEYRTKESYRIIEAINAVNSIFGTVCGYTFDAGPHAIIFCEFGSKEILEDMLEYLQTGEVKNETTKEIEGIIGKGECQILDVIRTNIGDGPKVVEV